MFCQCVLQLLVCCKIICMGVYHVRLMNADDDQDVVDYSRYEVIENPCHEGEVPDSASIASGYDNITIIVHNPNSACEDTVL